MITTDFRLPLYSRHLFSVKQYHQMIKNGILSENDRLELIRGELIKMSPIGTKHAAFVNRLNRIFNNKLKEQVLVSVQNPIELNDSSEPQPDIVLLKPHPNDYEQQRPTVKDILLIVEVSDTTLKYDQMIKLPLYAENKITEVWIIALQENSIEVYQNPTTEGYDLIQRYRPGDTLSILSFSNILFTVNEIFCLAQFS